MIEFKYAKGFVDEAEYQKVIDETRTYVARAEQDAFGGWVNLPINYDKVEFERIKKAAKKINDNSDYLVCIGIGGSYLGHRAVIEALGGEKGRTKILYAVRFTTYSKNMALTFCGKPDSAVPAISYTGPGRRIKLSIQKPE